VSEYLSKKIILGHQDFMSCPNPLCTSIGFSTKPR